MSDEGEDTKKGEPVRQEPEGVDEAQVSETEAELERLREALREKEEQTARQHDSVLRERAELENFKKRIQREKSDALRFAMEPLIRDLLPVVDNLERALGHGEGESSAITEGVRLVLHSLLGVLEQHGVRRIDARGGQFDPAFHEAMAQVDSPKHAPNEVVEQHHVGYLLHDRLLRPALVTVNARKMEDAVASERNRD